MASPSISMTIHSGSPGDLTPSHDLLVWLPIILLPLTALAILFLVGIPRFYKWARPATATASAETSPPSSSSRSSEPRDMPHLDALTPPRTSKDMRSDIIHHVHVS
ncbi:hypothetical protein QWA68_016493 [Fusarium oxysporum]|nr:hypothetical protein QWA68_016493 [Fusarium oxysporum]